MKSLVLGGAGFIGSHMVDWLLNQNHEVIVLDNFSTGRTEFIPCSYCGGLERNNPKLHVREGDCLNLWAVMKAMTGCTHVYHFQANADVRGGKQNTSRDLEQNLMTTWNVLEAMRLSGTAKHITFASSAVVYGEPDVFPTPENYHGKQTSVYGASKLGAEAYIQAYSEYFDFGYTILRFVSWIGERYTHGVIFDFVKQLQRTPNYLEVLGDGSQEKSYLHVADGIEGIHVATNSAKRGIFNLGHDDSITVRELAEIVVDEVGNGKVSISFGEGKRGWVGDAPVVKLDTSKLKHYGWEPQVSIEEGIRRTVRYLKANPQLLERA